MTKKEEIKSNILMTMRLYLDPVNMDILEAVIVKEFSAVEIVKMETLPATNTDINEYIIALFEDKRRDKLSDKTIRYYISTVRALIELINKPLLKVDENDIEYYLRHIRQQGNCNTSVNNRRRNLCAFFKWMCKQRIIAYNPVEAVDPLPEIEKPIEYMTSEDMSYMRDACSDIRDRALIEFLRSTAMRSGEVPLVRISDIDWASGKVVIFAHKNKRYRTVMLDKVAMQYLAEYIKERNLTPYSNEYLFTHKKGDKRKVLSNDGIRYAVKKIAKKSRVDRNVYPHLFRKGTATLIIKRGGSDEMAGGYLGHAPQSVTAKHYAAKGDEYIREIFDRYVRQ